MSRRQFKIVSFGCLLYIRCTNALVFTTSPVGFSRRSYSSMCAILNVTNVFFFLLLRTEGECRTVFERLRELRSQVARPVPSQRSIRAQESLHGKFYFSHFDHPILQFISFYDRMYESFIVCCSHSPPCLVLVLSSFLFRVIAID